MIKPVTFQGVENFDANLYALEVASRFLDHTNANGYYKDYGTELAASADGAEVTIGTGALVVQGRMVEISEAETVELESPVDGEVGYICLRIETYHPSDVENCSLVIYTGSTLAVVKSALTQQDVYSTTSNDENLVYECPIYSFAVSGSKITSLTLVLDAVESAVETAAEAKEAATSAVETAETASADVAQLSEQVGESLGTTIYKNGVALASVNYDKLANSDDTDTGGLYEHRIYIERRTDSQWHKLEFTFVNNVSTPYLTSDMTTAAEKAAALTTMFADIRSFTNNGDYINSNIVSGRRSLLSGIGFVKNSADSDGTYDGTTTSVWIGFYPLGTTVLSTYPYYFNFYTAKWSSSTAAFEAFDSALMYFHSDSDSVTVNLEDNVRQLSTGSPSGDGSVEVSTETDDDGNVYLVMGV